MKRFFKTMAFTLLGLVLSVNLMAASKTLIIDGSTLTSTATTAAADYTYGDFTITMSDGAKYQTSSGDNRFADSAILIGKNEKYIYNKTPLGKKITKFELYANKGASTKVSVGVLFSTTAISAYTTGTNTYTAALSTVDKVYDCSSKIPEGAKYFWYQVTNSNNSQVMFRITYEEEEEDPTKPSLSVSPTEIDFGTVEQNATIPSGQDVEVTFANLTTNDVTASISGDFNISKSGGFTSGDKITVTPKSTATIGTIKGTLTVKATIDDITKTIPVTMTVAEPEVGVSFEKATSAYTDWEFTNFESQQTHSDVTAHTGVYFGTTGGKASGSMVTKAKIAKPGTLQFFISKQSTNTSASSWKVSVSTDKSVWTQVGDAIDATSMTKGTWTEVNADLKSYSNVYVKLEYAGSTATRCIDDVVFIAPQSYNVTLATNPTSVGTITAKVNNVEIGAQVEEGQTVTLSAAPNDAHAYRFKEWQSDDVTIENNAFKMPNKAVSITAVFEQLYAVSLTTTGEGSGTATINGGTETIYVGADDKITLVAEAAAGSEFGGWTATDNIVIDKEGDAETFAYASSAGTITATFGVSALQPLDAPTLKDPTNVTYNSVTLNWQELANADGGYYVEILLNDEPVVYESGIGETSWTPDFTFQANTTYTYTVQGIGDGSTYAEENNKKAKSTFKTEDYPAATLTLSENGETSELVGKLNTAITLPTESTQACEGKVFVGWSENPIDGEVGKDQVTLLGATYTFTNPEQLTKTIYAVYAKETEGATTWNEVSAVADVEVGEYVIINNSFYLPSTTTSSAPSQVAAPTITDNKIADADVTAAMKWNLSDAGEGKFYVKNSGGDYLYETNDNNGLRVGSTSDTWAFEANDVALAMKGSNNSRYCATYKSGSDWRSYGSAAHSNYGDGGKLYLYKKTIAASTYSNYCTTCQAAVAAPTFSLAEGNYDEAKTLTLTATEGDIYYTINGGAETLYEEAIALNNRGTYEISAYAKVDDRTSEIVTKTYTLDWPYTLDELAASDVASGTSVQVTFENKEITGFYTNSQGKRYGIYVNVKKGGKDVEIYCNQAEHSETWEIGGIVSSKQAITGTWTYYSGGQQWEFCPSNWNDINYTAPAKIESLKITGDVDNKNYTAGQKLDFTGLIVTGVYSDNTEQNPHTEVVTADVDWTEVTLSENQVEAIAKATLNNAKTGNKDVTQSTNISGLSVGAKVELSKIEITTEASKKDFFVGRNFNHDGIVVTATYTNATTSNVTNACQFSTPTLANKGQETITITYSEGEGQDKKEVTTSYTINVKYMNLEDLVAEDIPTNTSVNVAFSDVEITGFYTNSSDKRAGVYVNVIGKNGSNIELYSGGTPSETLNGWQEGGKLASKGNYISGTWKYYDGGSVWEIDFGNTYAWATNIEYTAPEIYPTGITMSIPSDTVKQSKSLDLDAIFTPVNATVLNNLEWSSNNTQVTVVPSTDKKSATVTVAPDATVGTANITVKVDDKDGNELSATCVITIEEYTAPKYGLYNEAISEGDYLITYNYNGVGAMNTTISSNRAGITAVSPSNNIITTEDDAIAWHIAKVDENWTLYNEAAKKYAAGNGTNNQLALVDEVTDAAKWTITHNAEEDTYEFVNVGNKASSKNANLRRNTGSGFACYASTLANSGALTLYKAGFTPAAALTSIEIKGTLGIAEYFQGKSVKYDGLTVEGTYSDASKKTITEGIVWSADPTTFTEIGDNIPVTITATVQTKSGEVTDDAYFTVKVIESQQVSYGLVTSVNTLYDGAIIILGAVFGTATKPIYAVNQGFESKYLKAYRSNDPNGSDLEYENEVMKTAYASEITLKKVEEGWKLMDENNKYIISNNADIALSDNADEATVWTITIEEDIAKIASGSNIIYYNTSSPRFKTYTSAQQEIGIYMKNLVAVRPGLTAGKIGTICYPQAIAVVDGANLYQPNYKDDAVKNIYFSTPDEYKAGLPMIFQADREIMKVLFTGEEASLITDMEVTRGMVGNLGDTYEVPSGKYIFTQNKLWIVDQNCYVDKNRAYVDLYYVPYSNQQLSLELPSGAPRKTISLANASASTPTNFNGLKGNMKAQKVMKDGQFYIIHEAKMYNAQGIEVQ